MLDRLMQDLRFAFRQLVRHRLFSALLVATIAVAIGANVAIFSVLEGIVLRPLPYPEADRLLAVWESPGPDRSYQPFAAPDYLDVRGQAETLEEFGATSLRWANLSGGGEPVRLRTGVTTASLLRLLGVQPLMGRLFTDDEELDGNQHVAILSHGLWQSQFGGDPEVLGRRVILNGASTEIIGVMPAEFRFPTPWGGRDAARLYLPLVLPRDGSTRGSHWLGTYARTAPGVTPEQVEAELASIASGLAEAYPNTNAQTRMWVQPIMERTLGGVSAALIFLLSIVGLVLLIACANVASMLLARGMNRVPEFAVRASLGAGRRRLIRQQLTESLLLALVGGAAGVLLAYVGVDALKAFLPDDVPRTTDIGVNLNVLVFAAAVTLVTGVLVGLAPALFASRTGLAEVIKHGRASRGGGRQRFLSGLVMGQLGTGFILVNAALIMAVSYSNVLEQPMNFVTDEVLVSSISLDGPAYQGPEQRRSFWESLVQRTRGMPGVVQAGLTSKLPLRGGTNGGVLVRDQEFDPERQDYLVEYSFVDDGYHDAMGIRLLAGRYFDQRDLDIAAVFAGPDTVSMELPLIINREMAEELWPETDALGELVRPYSAYAWWHGRVVGIVENVRQWGPEREPLPELYFPHTAEVWGPIWGQLIIRTTGDPDAMAASIRGIVRQIDAEIPVDPPVTMGRILRESTAGRRFSTLLVSLFAATALLLIIAGTYGVMSYGVSRRTHEIGVRMTLGAHKTQVVGLFLGRAATLLAVGVAVGLFGVWVASRITSSLVYGVSALSPLYMAAAAGVMVVVALAATLVPVRRATTVDPLEALRVD